jgi:hypothetical protein
MSDQNYRLLYCSRNEIHGAVAQVSEAVQQILVSARLNNSRFGITGALLFNEGLFAQWLEGPRDAVVKAFEAISRDPRHSNVMVLESGMQGGRRFPDWSMAFASPSDRTSFESIAPVFEEAFANAPMGAQGILTLLHRILTV